jgi:hypothetical protein
MSRTELNIHLVQDLAGYDIARQAPFLLSKDSLSKVKLGISTSMRIFSSVFNATSAYFFMSQIMGTNTINSQNLKTVYKNILANITADSPLPRNSVREAIALVHETYKQKRNRLLSGEDKLPTFPFSGRQTVCVSLNATRIIKTRSIYCICCNLFNQDWADKNLLPAWVAFPVSMIYENGIARTVMSGDDTAELLDNLAISKGRVYLETVHDLDGPILGMTMKLFQQVSGKDRQPEERLEDRSADPGLQEEPLAAAAGK